ncbi:MAG TPA: JAB domain-containing protein [Chitinophagaceae bacterium]|nr:JAB domain-containing protein [Chitinophagaceae bacterium]
MKKAMQVAEIELVYRTNGYPIKQPVVNSSKKAYKILCQHWDRNKIELVEQFKVMLLSRSLKVLGILNLSSGGITGSIADPRLIFAAALKAGACNIILAHNHPSGSFQPSETDIELSCEIKAIGSLLKIKLLDHLLVTREGYCSLADKGYI